MKKNQKSVFTLVISFIITFSVFGQVPSSSQNKILPISNLAILKEISGRVTSFGVPISEANIIVENSNRKVKSDDKGFYKIKGRAGETIKYSYTGLNSVKIIIEDVTNILNIEMNPRVNKLDEVTVIDKSVSNSKSKSRLKRKPDKISTARGDLNVDRAGHSLYYVKGEDLNASAITLSEALRGKIPNYKGSFLRGTGSLYLNNSVLWEVDGVLFNDEPFHVDVANVKDITLINSLSGTVKYGSLGAGGVIIVRTKSAYFAQKFSLTDEKLYTNNNYYKGDAKIFNVYGKLKPYYLKVIEEVTNIEKAYSEYEKLSYSYSNNYDYFLDMAAVFQNKFDNNKKALEILSELDKKFSDDPEALKALAYVYQERGNHQRALDIYKKIIKIRPRYVQSFRDLANSYAHLKQFDNAWKFYMNYFYRGNELQGNGIGNIMYQEMENIYVNKSDEAKIKENFLVVDPKNTTYDVRMVFEWNTSEAEFEIEFVNPNKQVYNFRHTYAENAKRIKDEKIKGYSSEAFYIENFDKSNWLVNLNYFGNKKYAPTYLKVTMYYNWGKPNQFDKVKVFKLYRKGEKMHLFTINSINNPDDKQYSIKL